MLSLYKSKRVYFQVGNLRDDELVSIEIQLLPMVNPSTIIGSSESNIAIDLSMDQFQL
jgi:hypothetical protein